MSAGAGSERTPRSVAALVAALLTFGAAAAHAQNDLAGLGDEFDSPASLPNWSRVHLVEQWNAEPLEIYDIATFAPGRMTMMPYTVTWYQDYVGPYAFKPVTGDFVVTSDVRATGRDGVSVPQSLFSLAGLLVRTPRNVTPATWTPAGENYVFLSIGYGNGQPPTFQFERKTTTSGASNLILSPSPGPEARLQIARLGGYVILLRSEPGQPWVVHARYARPDFPATLQVGLVAYTDWGKVQFFSPWIHNQTPLDPPLPPGVPDPRPDVPYSHDLLASFDYVHFFRPTIPPALAGRDLSHPGQVSDAELLAFLGDNASPIVVGVAAGATTARRTLWVSPNPWVDRVSIGFHLSRPSATRLEVHDLQGRVVRRLDSHARDAGPHRVTWDGTDARGRAVAPGIYRVRLVTTWGSESAAICRVR